MLDYNFGQKNVIINLIIVPIDKVEQKICISMNVALSFGYPRRIGNYALSRKDGKDVNSDIE